MAGGQRMPQREQQALTIVLSPVSPGCLHGSALPGDTLGGQPPPTALHPQPILAADFCMPEVM